jgi:DNA-directed RNA polymerase subunit RPC12/RpoP
MKKQHLFRNFYKCYRCNEEWEDVWSATCDDDCPHCGARHCSPNKSEDEEERLLVRLCEPLQGSDEGYRLVRSIGSQT